MLTNKWADIFITAAQKVIFVFSLLITSEEISFREGGRPMSSMLEQAIIDANSLKEAAQKTAQEKIIEHFAGDIKETIEKILEQDEAPMEDPMEDPMGDSNGRSLG